MAATSNFPTGTVLTVNGDFGGTPTGGTLNVSAVTITGLPPANVDGTAINPSSIGPDTGSVTCTTLSATGQSNISGQTFYGNGNASLTGTWSWDNALLVSSAVIRLPSNGNISFSDSVHAGSADVFLVRAAANTLAIRNGANEQTMILGLSAGIRSNAGSVDVLGDALTVGTSHSLSSDDTFSLGAGAIAFDATTVLLTVPFYTSSPVEMAGGVTAGNVSIGGVLTILSGGSISGDGTGLSNTVSVADGTYTLSIGAITDGTVTITDGRIVDIQQAS